MSRTTVYKTLAKARAQGPKALADKSRIPHRHPRQTPPHIEQLLLRQRIITGLGPNRLKTLTQHTYGISIPQSTIRNILRRNRLSARRKHRKHSARAIELQALWPLQRFQLDLKHILDFCALPDL